MESQCFTSRQCGFNFSGSATARMEDVEEMSQQVKEAIFFDKDIAAQVKQSSSHISTFTGSGST